MERTDISVETPLIYSHKLSQITGRQIYLKLENVQPSGSFKLRGVANSIIQKTKDGKCKKIVCASGGGAALASAYAAFHLKVPCHIFVPNNVTPRILNRLRSFNAQVSIVGVNFQESNNAALEECKNDQAAYIHPYDDPDLWEGYADIVVSIKEQLKGQKPAAITVAVGGGGLLLGILNGLDVTGWTDVPIVAMEAVGSDCFNVSIKAGHVVSKPPTSIAKCLGASSPSPTLMARLHDYKITSHVITDREAVSACVQFADDHGYLVEPACGAALAAAYSNMLPDILAHPENYDGSHRRGCHDDDDGENSEKGPIVIIVCGGSDVTPDLVMEYIKMFNL